ncbi:MAG: FG-GAP repeat domain-containing protein [Thermogutta sp.]
MQGHQYSGGVIISRKRTLGIGCWLFAVAAALPMARAETAETGLKPLPYNHPGLTVDLGVGLWAWPLPYDVNRDGKPDLIVSCPDKPTNGLWYFENTGVPADSGLPIFRKAQYRGPTQHYVMPSYVGGELRVLTPGKIYPDFLTSGLASPVVLPIDTGFYRPVGNQPKGPRVRHHQWRLVDFDGDGDQDVAVAIEDWSDYGWDDAWDSQGRWKNGPLHGFVFIFRNWGSDAGPRFGDAEPLRAGDRPLDVFGCPSPNFADFDGDGDLDLLCGEFLDGLTYFENVGTRSEPSYAAGRRPMFPDGSPIRLDLEMIVPIAFDWDGDGDQDLVVGEEDGRVCLLENLGELDDNRTPRFATPRYFAQEADRVKCGALATPAVFDWDGDGDEDILAGNTAGYIEFFENQSGPGVESPQWAGPVRLRAGERVFRITAGPNGSVQGPAEAKWGYTVPSVADWDGDGLPDLVVNSIWGKVVWLKNVGTRTQPELAPPQPVEVAWEGTPPKPAWVWWQPQPSELVTQWRTTPAAVDWTGDGLIDLVMLDAEGYLALFERTRRDGKAVLLPPQRVFFGTNIQATDSQHRVVQPGPGPLRLNSGSAGGSGRRKLWVADWDGDGKLDLLVNSTNANWLRQVRSDADGWHFEDMGPLVGENVRGHTTSPTVADFNRDGIPDLLVGAEDGRFYYYRNPRSRGGPP